MKKKYVFNFDGLDSLDNKEEIAKIIRTAFVCGEVVFVTAALSSVLSDANVAGKVQALERGKIQAKFAELKDLSETVSFKPSPEKIAAEKKQIAKECVAKKKRNEQGWRLTSEQICQLAMNRLKVAFDAARIKELMQKANEVLQADESKPIGAAELKVEASGILKMEIKNKIGETLKHQYQIRPLDFSVKINTDSQDEFCLNSFSQEYTQENVILFEIDENNKLITDVKGLTVENLAVSEGRNAAFDRLVPDLKNKLGESLSEVIDDSNQMLAVSLMSEPNNVGTLNKAKYDEIMAAANQMRSSQVKASFIELVTVICNTQPEHQHVIQYTKILEAYEALDQLAVHGEAISSNEKASALSLFSAKLLWGKTDKMFIDEKEEKKKVIKACVEDSIKIMAKAYKKNINGERLTTDNIDSYKRNNLVKIDRVLSKHRNLFQRVIEKTLTVVLTFTGIGALFGAVQYSTFDCGYLFWHRLTASHIYCSDVTEKVETILMESSPRKSPPKGRLVTSPCKRMQFYECIGEEPTSPQPSSSKGLRPTQLIASPRA